jgi:peptidyl-prolyl cis-trans isomerase SurA
MRKPAIFALTVFAFVSLALADQVVEEIVARINDSIITRSQYQRERQQLVQDLQQQGATADQVAAREKDALRDLIDQRLMLDKAKELGLNADNEVVKRIAQMMKDNGITTTEELEKMAEQSGTTLEDFKDNLKTQILTQMVIQREVGSHVNIPHAEIERYYNEHKKDFDRPEQVRISEILIPAVPPAPQPPAGEKNQTPPPQPDPTPEQLAAAEQKANSALAIIKQGAKFDEVARKGSSGPTAAQGGDLGYFKRGVLSKDLEDKTFAMKPGDVTDVIHTKQGFVILKVTQHISGGIPPLKDVENQIMDNLYMQKLQPELRAYLTKLREQAYIDVRSGYVDTGASPNQTKPIVAQGPEPGAKSKPGKRKKKFGVF